MLRRVAAEAPDWLAPGGSVLFETGERQVPDAVAALADAGLAPDVRTDDDLGAAVLVGTVLPGTVVPGTRPGSGTRPRR